jgi:predicted nuclease of predicted toxin-antitoxin system
VRFLVDECTGPAVARWLRSQGHDVLSVYEQARGLDDDAIIVLAWQDRRILVTNDKDFGEKIFRAGRSHRGVILLRLEDERAQAKIAVLERLMARFAEQLAGEFVVVSETRVRFARGSSEQS